MGILEDKEFLEYKKELEERGNYTLPTKEDYDKFHTMCIPPKVFSMEKAMSHPFYFAWYVTGIKPRVYQLKMMDELLNYKNVVAVTGRQSGKSITVALFALWAVLSNAFPSGPYKDTKILIVSHTDNAAKKLLGEVYKMIGLADERMAKFTRNSATHEKGYFKQRIKKQTQYELEFTKGSIKAYPPTDVARGNSADILIVDEAAKLNASDPDYFFSEVAEPTTAATKGRVILTSTPGGISGFFYRHVRPDADTAIDGWKRIWYPWTIIDDEEQLEALWLKRNIKLKLGDEMSWKNEYEASFNSGLHSWINPELVDNIQKPHLIMEEAYGLPVYVGLDFGDTHSRTVATIVRPFKDDNNVARVKLIYHKEFEAGYNNANIVAWMKNMALRFNIKKIIADDCVGGKVPINLLKDARFVVEGFQFSKSKEEGYELFKNAILNETIQMYEAPDIAGQIKALNAIELPSGRIAVRKPTGGRDDICDSFMMACYPFIQIKNKARIKVY
jgi:phage terminase large subunit-like protein